MYSESWEGQRICIAAFAETSTFGISIKSYSEGRCKALVGFLATKDQNELILSGPHPVSPPEMCPPHGGLHLLERNDESRVIIPISSKKIVGQRFGIIVQGNFWHE